MMRGRFAPSLGQVVPPQQSVQFLSLCTLIKPALYIPGVNDLIRKIGCNPAMRGALSAAIIQHYTKTTGTTVEAAPWYTQMLAIAGPEILADCACQDKSLLPPPGWKPPAPPASGLSLSNPVVLLGLAAAVAAVIFATTRRPAQPQIVYQAPAAAPAPAPKAAPAPAPAVSAPAPSAPPKAEKPSASPRASQRRRYPRRYR